MNLIGSAVALGAAALMHEAGAVGRSDVFGAGLRMSSGPCRRPSSPTRLSLVTENVPPKPQHSSGRAGVDDFDAPHTFDSSASGLEK